MIAVIAKDAVHLYNMGVDEFSTLYRSSGIKSPEIRSHSEVHFSKSFYKKGFLVDYVDAIEVCYCELPEGLLTKNVNSLDDLDYYVAPNGNKYTCETEYLLTAKPQMEQLHVATQEAAGVIEEVIKNRVEAKPEDSVIIPEVTAPEVAIVADEITVDNSLPNTESDVEEIMPDNFVNAEEPEVLEEKEVVIIPDSIKAFDSYLGRQPHVARYGRSGILNHIRTFQEGANFEDKSIALQSSLTAKTWREILEYDSKVNQVIDTHMGKTSDLTDSALDFPVYSAIVGKIDLTEKFSFSKVVGARFIRFCPIATTGYGEDGEIMSHIHAIKITNADVDAVRKKVEAALKDSKKKFSSLPKEEQYRMFEEELAKLYRARYGPMTNEKLLNEVGIDRSITAYLGKLDDAGFYTDHLIDDEGYWACRIEEHLVLDNRPVINGVKVPLEIQLATVLSAAKAQKVPPAVMEEPAPVKAESLERSEVVTPATEDFLGAAINASVKDTVAAELGESELTDEDIIAEAIRRSNAANVEPSVTEDFLGAAINKVKSEDPVEPRQIMTPDEVGEAMSKIVIGASVNIRENPDVIQLGPSTLNSTKDVQSASEEIDFLSDAINSTIKPETSTFVPDPNVIYLGGPVKKDEETVELEPALITDFLGEALDNFTKREKVREIDETQVFSTNPDRVSTSGAAVDPILDRTIAPVEIDGVVYQSQAFYNYLRDNGFLEGGKRR